MLKCCARCYQTKPLEAFYRRWQNRVASYCKACEKDRKPRKTPVRFESDTHRECRKCGEIKPKASGFYKSTVAKSYVAGYCIYCKACQQTYNRAANAASNGAYGRAYNEKIKGCPQRSLKRRTINLVRKSLERHGVKERGVTGGFWAAVGYTKDVLLKHIERQFTEGMCWENMHLWHIDHIVPDSAFGYKSMACEGFRQSWALSNLRPLWATENTQKGARPLFLI